MKNSADELEIFQQHHDSILAHISNDPYARSLGIQLTQVDAGFAEATLEIKNHMLNAHGTVHGAVIYALADHVFSVACNTYGKTSVGVSTTIQFVEAAELGDQIMARASEVKRTHRTGFYRIDVYHRQNLIATMDAVCYRKNQHFIQLEANG